MIVRVDADKVRERMIILLRHAYEVGTRAGRQYTPEQDGTHGMHFEGDPLEDLILSSE